MNWIALLLLALFTITTFIVYVHHYLKKEFQKDIDWKADLGKFTLNELINILDKDGSKITPGKGNQVVLEILKRLVKKLPEIPEQKID